MVNWYVLWGAVNGLIAVALGAFAAHGLRGRIDPLLLETFQTGVDYQAMHALAILAIGSLAQRGVVATWQRWSAWCFFGGIILFSGSLYLLALTGNRSLGVVTPFGGGFFLLGWLLLAIGAVRD